MKYWIPAAGLLIVGCVQMAGDLSGAASWGSGSPRVPAPRVFTSRADSRPSRPGSSSTGPTSQDGSIPRVTPRSYRVRAYNRRNAYGAALSYADWSRASAPARCSGRSCATFCGPAPLLRELRSCRKKCAIRCGCDSSRAKGNRAGGGCDFRGDLRGGALVNNGWTGGQYSMFRVLLGTYLFIHFAHLLAWGAELFSNRGMLGNPSHSPLFGIVPSVLSVSDSPATVVVLLLVGTVAAAFFAIGGTTRSRRWRVVRPRVPSGPEPANREPACPILAGCSSPTSSCPRRGALAARGRADPAGGWRGPIFSPRGSCSRAYSLPAASC
jgi:hypothetical protein